MPEEKEKPKEPTTEISLKEQINFFIQTPLKSSDTLKKQLYKDDSFYMQTPYAWVGADDAKKLFFYGVCVEVAKACADCIQIGALFDEIPTKEKGGSEVGRMVHNAIIDRQQSLTRKLGELLSLVINLSKTKNDVEYRIFHSAKNLDRFLNQQKAFKDVFGVNNNNTQSSIDDYKNRIEEDLKLIGGKLPWFIDEGRYRSLRPSVFKGWMKMYMDAVDLSNDDEKIMLGINHERYSLFSQNIHPTVSSHGYEADEDWNTILGNLQYISMTAMHIMDRCFDLLGLKDEQGLKKIMGEKFEKSNASRHMSMFSKKFDVDEIVFVHSNDLAEILECKVGKFGYTIYKVKYLSTPPLPEYPEEWIEGRRLTRLFKKEHIRPFFEKSLEPASKIPDMAKDALRQMLKEPDAVVAGLMKKTLVQLHKDNVLTLMLTHSNIIQPIAKKKS